MINQLINICTYSCLGPKRSPMCRGCLPLVKIGSRVFGGCGIKSRGVSREVRGEVGANGLKNA